VSENDNCGLCNSLGYFSHVKHLMIDLRLTLTTVTAEALQSCGKKSRKGTPEEESLEATTKNRHRRCKGDILGQTVRNMGSSNREGPLLMVDSRVWGMGWVSEWAVS